MATNASHYSQPNTTTETNLLDAERPTSQQRHPQEVTARPSLPFHLPRSTNYANNLLPSLPENSSLSNRRESWHPTDLHRTRKDSNGDGPFAFTPQLLESNEYGDYHGRRWSYSSNTLQPSAQISHLNRPWTSSNAQSYYTGNSSSTFTAPPTVTTFPIHYAGNSRYQPQPTPPTTSSSTSSYDRPSSSSYDRPSPSSYGGSRPSTTASIVSISSTSSFPSVPTPLSNFDSFYGLDPKTRGSTDTIVDATQVALHASAPDDSNPFFFQRQLQNLQAEASSHVPSLSTSHSQYANQHSTQSENYQFYDYATPPSTANSTASNQFFDSLASLPLPPSTSPAASGSLLQAQQASPAYGGNAYGGSRTSPSATGLPSPYSLIVPNPDPSSAASRPHLCTHCNETFRRIHDAKRHAYGALGIKNYACMGGCGMSFKRSEGRSRHWMREEVAGVGPPGRIWGGKGCEERHARVMSGTMEEDRRLRNKARRERITMLNARQQVTQAASGSPPGSSGNGSTGQASHESNSLDSSGPGPIRHSRSGFAVAGAPY